MPQIERIYWIDSQIRAGRYPNAAAVSERFGVSRRAAYNDRDYLIHRLSAPIAYDRKRGGWKYTEPVYLLPFLALPDRQAAALRRSLLAAREYLGPADAEAVDRLAGLLSPYLKSPAGGEHTRFGGAVHLAHAPSADLIRDCERAVERRHRLRILYFSAGRGELTERVVRPYELLYWRGEPHMIAWCELREDMRQFFLGRIREWQLLEPDAAFARDPAFHIDAYLQRGLDLRHGEPLVKVRVRFSSYQARWIRERRYHPSQRIEETDDGGLILSMEVAGIEEVRRWILGYGEHAEALAPEELRNEIAQTAAKLQEIYRSSG